MVVTSPSEGCGFEFGCVPIYFSIRNVFARSTLKRKQISRGNRHDVERKKFEDRCQLHEASLRRTFLSSQLEDKIK